MGIGFSLSTWGEVFDEDLPLAQRFVERMNPSQDWNELLSARPQRGVGCQLWTEFGVILGIFLEQYGAVAPYEAVTVLPVDFTENVAPTNISIESLCLNLREDSSRSPWYVLEAEWIWSSWEGRDDAAFAKQCEDDAKRFEQWMSQLGPDGIDEAIDAFLDLDEAHDIVTSYLELRWIEAAKAAFETRCPVAVSL